MPGGNRRQDEKQDSLPPKDEHNHRVVSHFPCPPNLRGAKTDLQQFLRKLDFQKGFSESKILL